MGLESRCGARQRRSVGAPLGSPPWPCETSPESPAPVRADRQRDRRLGRPARRGVGRGPGRPGQPPAGRRHRLPDPARLGGRHLGPGHLPAHPLRLRSTRRWSRAPAWSCTPSRRTTPTAAPSRSSAREIRMVGLGELLARLERRRQLLAAEGLFAAELKRPLPFLPGTGRAGHRPELRRRARRRRERPPPLAGGRLRGGVRRDAGPARGRRGDRGARPPRPRPDGRRHRRRPRRRLGRGPAAVLRRGPDPRRARAPRTPVVSAIGHEPDSPLLDLVADVRASTPTDAAKLVVPDVAEELRRVAVGPRPAALGAVGGWLDREQAGARRAALPAGAGRPAHAARRPADEVDALRERARRTLGHRLDRAADDIGHQRARARALSPLATLQRGYAVLQDADGHVRHLGRAVSPPAPRSASGSPTAGCTPPRPTGRPRPDRAEPPMARRERWRRPSETPLRGGPRGADRGGPHARGRRHHARGVAGAVGARRAARHRSARSGSTARGSGSTPSSRATRPTRPTARTRPVGPDRPDRPGRVSAAAARRPSVRSSTGAEP